MKKLNKTLSVILAILMVMSAIPITASATEAVDKTGEHNYQLVPNTKPDSGCVKTYKCSGCGDTYKESVGTTHTNFKTPEFAPTETKDGLTVGISCSECGAVLLEQELIPALGTTDDSSVIVSGTCGTSTTWTFNKKTGALIISGTGAISNYKSASVRPWENYEDDIKSIIINNGITKIGNYAFDNFGSLIYVSIPDSVTSIGSNAFRYCSILRNIEIPDSVDTINYSAFEGCKKLTYIKLSNRITYIQDTLFKDCTSITHVTVPDTVYYINASAFSGCTKLKSVTIGKNVTNIYNNAFSGCTALAEVYYTGTEEQWNKIVIGTGNDPLLMATNRYDGSGGDILTGHQNHKNTVITVEPTCTEAGYTKFVCECGYEYTVDYDALGHTLEEIPVILPTSSRVGYTRGEKCTTCNMVTAEPVMVPMISESARAGDAGYNVIWVYNEATQTMEFYGKGYMKYYDPIVYASNESDERPWAVYGYSDIQTVVIHEGIEGINELNFYRFTGLKMVSLPSTLERIVDDAFEGCEDFYVKYNGTREDWDKIDGHLTNYDRIIFNDYSGVTASGTHGDNLYWNFDATTFTLTIYGTGPMESVADYEYPWYEYIPVIENIVIKEGVTSIGNSAFYECGFKTVSIPDTVTTIETAAFMYCGNYESITIPGSVTTIGNNAFYPDNVFKYKLEDVYYLGTEEMWNNISMGTFNMLLMESYVTIHFVKYAGYCGNNITYTFDGSTLILTGTGDMCEFEVDWSGEVYSPWANWALEIEHIVVGDGITSISDDAFSSCGSKLQTVTFGSDVKKIGAYAFYWCKSLTEIIFPDGLTVIGKYAFYNSTSIKTIVLPDSIEEIEKGAFCDCTGITDVHYQGTESQWDEIIINSENNELINAKIHYNSKEVHDHNFNAVVTPPTCMEGGYTTYTCACGDTYVDDYVYKTGHTDSDNDVYCDVCGNYIYTATGTCGDKLTWTFNESTDTLTISGTGDMYDYQGNTAPWQDYKPSIKKVVISDGVTSIGESAFTACQNIESVTIGNDVTEIGLNAFNSCENLKTVVMGNSVEIIGEQAFFYCESLTSIIIPDSVSRIGDYAFMYCSVLETVTMGSGVEKVGHDAFYLCKKLKDVYYNGSAVDWQNIYFLFGMDSFLASATIHYLKQAHTHDYETVVTAPTCTEQGYTTYTCACGDTYIADYVDALGHNHTSKITTPATHTATGAMTYTCTCGDTYTEVIEKLEKHNYDAVITAPTCTERGYTTYTCECGDSYIDDYVDALGHTPATAVEENYVAPNCTEKGSIDIVVYCSVCDEEISRETEEIDANGHSYKTVITSPTCTEQGYTTYTCSVCGDTYVDDEVSALGHTDGNVVEENYVAPTCTENGSKDIVTYCTVCNVETNRETVVVSATGHNYVNGKCENCGDNDVYYYNGTFHIQSPSTTSIRHKDGIKLHAKVEGTAPAGSYVKWTASNGKFKTEEINDGNSLKIVSDSNGKTTFTATLYSADGEILATDTIEMNSKAGFFDKIGSFFRSLFGGTKIYEN